MDSKFSIFRDMSSFLTKMDSFIEKEELILEHEKLFKNNDEVEIIEKQIKLTKEAREILNQDRNLLEKVNETIIQDKDSDRYNKILEKMIKAVKLRVKNRLRVKAELENFFNNEEVVDEISISEIADNFIAKEEM